MKLSEWIKFRGISNDLPQDYISGCVVTKHSGANTLDISAGTYYDPTTGIVQTFPAQSGVSAGTLGVSQWNQVYITGTGTVSVVNNADPPTTAYAGTARKKASTNERWIGSFLTTSGSAIYDFQATETAHGAVELIWKATVSGSPFRFLNGVRGTLAFGAETPMSGAVPRYVASSAYIAITLDNNNTSGGGSYAPDIFASYGSIDGTNSNAFQFGTYISATGKYPAVTLWSPIEPSTPGIYYKGNDAATTIYLDAAGFRFAR